MNMKEIRKEKNVTLDALSESTGINKGQLSRIERGLVDPTTATLRKIAKGLKTELIILFK
jgi:transcriptional regulator with XRE-family HTH domain